jgi:branched-chain amino acid transport system substrate-binding protein
MIGCVPQSGQGQMVDARDGAWDCPRTAHGGVAIAPRRRLAARASISMLVGAILVGGSCRTESPPPRIAYPLPWLDAVLAHVAQPAIDAWGRPRVAEIPESLMARVAVRPGYAGDIEFAEAMVAIPGLVAAVGPQSSRATLLVAPIYAERGIPMIAATATSDRVRALGPWVFQLAPGNAVEGAFIARFVLDRLAARRVTVFFLDADEYGIGLRDGVVRELRLRGVTPVDQVGIIAEADMSRRVAESLRRATPDVVVVAARSPEALALTRALHGRLPRARLVFGDGVPLNPAFVRAAGPAAALVYAVAWWSPDLPGPESRAFAVAYARAKGAPASAAEAMYYDAIMVAAQAVRDVGPGREAIRRYLSELGIARPRYRGITGPITFAPDRPVNLLMTHVVDGAVVMVPGAEGGP